MLIDEGTSHSVGSKCSWDIACLSLCLYSVTWISTHTSCHWMYNWNRTLKFAILFFLNSRSTVRSIFHHQQQCPRICVFGEEEEQGSAKGSAVLFSPWAVPGLTCSPGQVLCLCFQLQQQLCLAAVQGPQSASVSVGLRTSAKSLLVLSANPPLLINEGMRLGNFLWFLLPV